MSWATKKAAEQKLRSIEILVLKAWKELRSGVHGQTSLTVSFIDQQDTSDSLKQITMR